MEPTDEQLDLAYSKLHVMKGYIMCPHCYKLHHPFIYIPISNGKERTYINYLAWKELKCLKCNKELYEMVGEDLAVIALDEIIAGYISILNQLGYKTTNCCSGHIGVNPSESEYYITGGEIIYEGTPYVTFKHEYKDVLEVAQDIKSKGSRYKDQIEIHRRTKDLSFGFYGLSSDSYAGDYLEHIVTFKKFLRGVTSALCDKKRKKTLKDYEDDLALIISKKNMKR